MHQEIYLYGISLLEWIGIAQAVILLLTGVVVAWYTFETKRIREETSVQNTLLAEQLRLMQSTKQHEIEKEMSFIKPFFRFTGGMIHKDRASYEFINKGGSAKKLLGKSKGTYTVSVTPSRFLDTNESGKVTLRLSDFIIGEKYPFEIVCNDKLGNEHTFHFCYQHRKGITEEEPV